MPKGFEEVTEATHRKLRLILRVGGLDKNGKTHFGLTAPAPIGVLDMDRGLEGVVEKFVAEKTIYFKSFRNMPNKTQKDYDARYEAFEDGFFTLLADSAVRTVLVDTDTESWEMIRLSYLGKLTQVKPIHYAQVNGAYRKLIDAAYDSDKNLILISRYKKQYVQKSKTSDDRSWNGKFEPSGMNELPFLVQANLRSRLAMEDGELKHTIEVINCRQNMNIAGDVYEGDMATFPWLASFIMDGTTPEDWE